MHVRSAITGFALLFSLSFSTSLLAELTEGFEYQLVDPPVPTETGDKVEVLELFWYGCPHCYHLEPVINPWIARLPEGTQFRRMPAVFGNPLWEMHARAFYTAEALGVLEQMHEPLFTAVNQHKNPLKTEAALARFFAQHGVSREKFSGAFNSFFVDTKVRRAKTLSKEYGIDGVPALVINGKYRTSGTSAGGRNQMLEVADYLIAKESAAASIVTKTADAAAQVKAETEVEPAGVALKSE